MKQPTLSVIIVSYNTSAITVKSIGYVRNSEGINEHDIEIILVDNNSSDNTVEAVQQRYPSVRIIQNKTNMGFGHANNQGLNISKGKYILFLNSDAFVQPNTIKTMLDILKNNQDISSVAPKLTYRDGSTQPSAGHFPTPIRVFAWMFSIDRIPLIKNIIKPYHINEISWYSRVQNPDWLMGACMMFRKDELADIGGFDDKMFMYVEEVDLYMRLWKKHHKKILFEPSIQATHLDGASNSNNKSIRRIKEYKGIEYLYNKHYSGFAFIIKPILIAGTLLRMMIFSVMPSKRQVYETYKNYILGKTR